VSKGQIVVQIDADGQRLDRFVCTQRPALGRAAARRLIEAGQVRVNGRRAAAGQRLHAGDAIAFESASESVAALPDPDAPCVIRYEDAWLLCADKPAGMPSHPLRPGELGSLASALLARYPELAQVGHSPREPGIVHRLDTDTSGLLLAARDPQTFAALRALLTAGAIDKRYLALCAGRPAVPAQHEAWLSARGARVSVRAAPFGSALRVRTELLAAEPVGEFSLLTVRVHLARRHQVRAHLAALGHPIAADALYGGPPLPDLRRHFLHAAELRFAHPHTCAALELSAPLPDDLRSILDRLR